MRRHRHGIRVAAHRRRDSRPAVSPSVALPSSGTTTTSSVQTAMTPRIKPPVSIVGPAGDASSLSAALTLADDGLSGSGELISPDEPGITSISPHLPDPVMLRDSQERARRSRIPRRTPLTRAATQGVGTTHLTIARAPLDRVYQPQPRFDIDVTHIL